jgi:S-adenosylmethionine hydrolase
VTVVDLTHGIPPHDVRAGALALWRCAPWLRHSVVLSVVDPGVGTARRGVAVEVEEAGVVLVGPDNGLMVPAAWALGGAPRAVKLAPLPQAVHGVGATFDGRDLFAPVAARLASGEWSLVDAGEPVDPASLAGEEVAMAHPAPDGSLVCEVLWVDRFGNAQLNSPGIELGELVRVETASGGLEARRVKAFGELRDGELGLVTDSYGLLALAFNGSPAAQRLELAEGDVVRLRAGRQAGTHSGRQAGTHSGRQAGTSRR